MVPTLCNPIDCSSPGSSVYGILHTGILEWIAIFFSRGFFWSRDQTQVSCFAARFFTIWTIREALQHLLYHTKAWTQTTSKAIRYRVCIAWHGIPKRDSSPELKLDIGKGSSSEVLKMNLEGQCETVRKGIEGCRGESICKVMKLWGNGLHLGKS